MSNCNILIDFGSYIMIDRFHFSISACTLIQERDSKVIYLFKLVVLSRIVLSFQNTMEMKLSKAISYYYYIYWFCIHSFPILVTKQYSVLKLNFTYLYLSLSHCLFIIILLYSKSILYICSIAHSSKREFI